MFTVADVLAITTETEDARTTLNDSVSSTILSSIMSKFTRFGPDCPGSNVTLTVFNTKSSSSAVPGLVVNLNNK